MPIKDGHTLRIPDDPAILAAVGEVALRHGQLDHVLRLTVKIILGLPIREGLNATAETARQGSRALRDRVRKLAKQKLGDGEALARLDALLERSRHATDRRNKLLHRLWAYDKDGNPIIYDDDDTPQPIPSMEDLETVATEFANVAVELNEARLRGFLWEALDRAGTANVSRHGTTPPSKDGDGPPPAGAPGK